MDRKGVQLMRKIRKFLSQEEGASTIEATLVYPSILIATLVMVLFTIVVYQQVEVHYKARQVADGVAHIWNNQSAASMHQEEPFDGSFTSYTTDEAVSKNDGLYWRILGNSMLDKFKISFLDGFGDGVSESKTKYAQTKLAKSTMKVTVDFDNSALFGSAQVIATAEGSFKMPGVLTELLGLEKTVKAVSHADVYDTVESIRNTRLAIIFASGLVEKSAGADAVAKAIGLK